MNKSKIYKIALSAMFLSIGLVLPTLTMQIKEIGDTLLPMHLPVMLCGVLCGYGYGAIIGAVLPILRSLAFGMPPLYPNALWMAAELMAYGLVIGLMYKLLPKKLPWIYVSLITSQIIGRIVWAGAKVLLLGLTGKTFTFEMFLSGGFIDAAPGIILQIILIPIIVTVLKHKKFK